MKLDAENAECTEQKNTFLEGGEKFVPIVFILSRVMMVKVIREKDFRVSVNQLIKNDLIISNLYKCGRPLEVLEAVRYIEFVKNRSKQKFVLVYPEPRNIIKEVFEVSYGKVVRVVSEINETGQLVKNKKVAELGKMCYN